MRDLHFRVGFVLLTTLVLSAFAKAEPPTATASEALRMEATDRVIEQGISRGNIPGAVLLVERGGKTVYFKAYGNRSVQPAVAPMTTDTIFDLASLSKCVGCAPSIMTLAERGKLKLSDAVAQYIPAFAANGKENVTIEQLLLHRGGLVPDNSIKDYDDGPASAWEKILTTRPTYEPGTKFIYSDMSFLVLGKLVKEMRDRRAASLLVGWGDEQLAPNREEVRQGVTVLPQCVVVDLGLAT